jgi:hypothetical protein
MFEVHRVQGVPEFGGGVEERTVFDEVARVVHEDVYSAAVDAKCGRRKLGDGLLVPNVTVDRNGAATTCPDLGNRRRKEIGVMIIDHDRGAFGGKSTADPATNAGTTSRYNGHSAGKQTFLHRQSSDSMSILLIDIPTR